MFSTGLDQRLHTWRLNLEGAGSRQQVGTVSMELLASTVTEVAEPSSLDAVHTGETFSVLIAGRGVQVVECHGLHACLKD